MMEHKIKLISFSYRPILKIRVLTGTVHCMVERSNSVNDFILSV